MLQCNCSIFGDETTREAIVVDPGDNIAEIQAILAKHQLKVKAIVITHAHIDHIGGAAKLKAATGAPVHMNQNDQELYNHLDVQASWLGMDTPERPTSTRRRATGIRSSWATRVSGAAHPGHTQGSISIWIPSENKLVAGDTLFRDSIGRTDLPGGDGRQFCDRFATSCWCCRKTRRWCRGTAGIPTIGREKQRNPFLQGL
jgi:glyoxylase-like metal-dependent hydrolase (beta-lactamase superfamily II)